MFIEHLYFRTKTSVCPKISKFIKIGGGYKIWKILNKNLVCFKEIAFIRIKPNKLTVDWELLELYSNSSKGYGSKANTSNWICTKKLSPFDNQQI